MEQVEGRWHAVTVSSKRETWALANLRKNGHYGYLPMWRRDVVRHDYVMRKGIRRRIKRQEVVATPLFPGYLFVLVRASHEWPSIYTTHGVKSVVGTADRAAPVRRGVVEALQAAEAAGFNELMSREALNQRIAALDAGDPIRLTMGGHVDFLEAVYCGEVDDERCEVLVSLCGRDSRVKVEKARVSR